MCCTKRYHILIATVTVYDIWNILLTYGYIAVYANM